MICSFTFDKFEIINLKEENEEKATNGKQVSERYFLKDGKD